MQTICCSLQKECIWFPGHEDQSSNTLRACVHVADKLCRASRMLHLDLLLGAVQKLYRGGEHLPASYKLRAALQ